MTLAVGKKDIFVRYLDTQRDIIYTSILDCNRSLVHSLYKKKLSSSLEGDPLWLFHGGELINLYGDKKNRVPTKDIDLKLYFTGAYSIPTKVYKRGVQMIPKISLADFDFYDGRGTEQKEQLLIRKCREYLSKHQTPSKKSCYQLLSMGEKQKVDLCVALVANARPGCFSQLNMKAGTLKSGLSIDDVLDTSKNQRQTIQGDTCKVFVVNTPYVTQVGRDNMPYDINDKVLSNMGAHYDEDIDGYPIDEDTVRQIGERVETWTTDERLPDAKSKEEYLRRKLRIIRLKNQKFKLSSVIGVVIVYNESRGRWYLFQEGILDLYIDYSAGHHLDLEKRYLGRYEDGSFPSVNKRVTYGTKTSLMRFPSLPWLIQDQLRMLYVTIRGSYLGCDETRCKWLPLGGGAAGGSTKYLNKVRGLLTSFESMVSQLQEGDLSKVSDTLSSCKGKDMETCGPLAFITTLFQSFEFEFLKGAPQASKRPTKRSQRLTKRSQRLTKRSKRLTKRSKRLTKRSQRLTKRSKLAQSSKGSTMTSLIYKMTGKNNGMYMD